MAGVQKSLDEIYQSDIKEYYSGNNVDVFFNNVYVDECSGIGFRSVINSSPTFGYNSEYFNSIAKGNFRVEGKFTVNFVANGYVERIIQKGEQDRRNADFTPLGRVRPIGTEQPTTNTNGIFNLNNPTFINTVIFDPQATGMTNEERDAAKAKLRDYIWGHLKIEEAAFIKSLRQVLVGTYFDILMMVGNPNTDSYDVKNIVDAQILDVSMEIVKGMPLQMMYTFVARDIDRPSGRPNPFNFLQGNVPSAKSLDLTPNEMLDRIIDATKKYTVKNILDVHMNNRSLFGDTYDNSQVDLYPNVTNPQPGINTGEDSNTYIKLLRANNPNSVIQIRDDNNKTLSKNVIEEMHAPLSFSVFGLRQFEDDIKGAAVTSRFEEVAFGGMTIPAPSKSDIKSTVARTTETIDIQVEGDAKEKILAQFNSENSNDKLLDPDNTEDADIVRYFSFLPGAPAGFLMDQKEEQFYDRMTSPETPTYFHNNRFNITHSLYDQPVQGNTATEDVESDNTSNPNETPVNPFVPEEYPVQKSNRVDIQIKKYDDGSNREISKTHTSTERLQAEYDGIFKDPRGFQVNKEFKPFVFNPLTLDHEDRDITLTFTSSQYTKHTVAAGNLFTDSKKSLLISASKDATITNLQDGEDERFASIKNLVDKGTFYSVAQMNIAEGTDLQSVSSTWATRQENGGFTLVIDKSGLPDEQWKNKGNTAANNLSYKFMWVIQVIDNVPEAFLLYFGNISGKVANVDLKYFNTVTNKIEAVPNPGTSIPASHQIKIAEWEGTKSRTEIASLIAGAIADNSNYTAEGTHHITQDDLGIVYVLYENNGSSTSFISPPRTSKFISGSGQYYDLPLLYSDEPITSKAAPIKGFNPNNILLLFASNSVHFLVYDYDESVESGNLFVKLRKQFDLEKLLLDNYLDEFKKHDRPTHEIYTQSITAIGGSNIKPLSGIDTWEFEIKDFSPGESPTAAQISGLASTIIQRGTHQFIPMRINEHTYFLTALSPVKLNDLKSRTKLSRKSLYICDMTTNLSSSADFISMIGGIFGTLVDDSVESEVLHPVGIILSEPSVIGMTNATSFSDISIAEVNAFSRQDGIIRTAAGSDGAAVEALTKMYMKTVIEKIIDKENGFFSSGNTELSRAVPYTWSSSILYGDDEAVVNNVWTNVYEQVSTKITPTECTFLPVSYATSTVQNEIFGYAPDKDLNRVSDVVTYSETSNTVTLTFGRGGSNYKSGSGDPYEKSDHYGRGFIVSAPNYQASTINGKTVNKGEPVSFLVYFGIRDGYPIATYDITQDSKANAARAFRVKAWDGIISAGEIAAKVETSLKTGTSALFMKYALSIELVTPTQIKITFKENWVNKNVDTIRVHDRFVANGGYSYVSSPPSIVDEFTTSDIYFNITNIKTAYADNSASVSWGTSRWPTESDDIEIRNKGMVGVIAEATVPLQLGVRTADKEGKNHKDILYEIQGISQPHFIPEVDSSKVVFSARKKFVESISNTEIQILKMSNMPLKYYGKNRLTNLYKIVNDNQGRPAAARTTGEELQKTDTRTVRNEVISRASQIYSALTEIYNYKTDSQRRLLDTIMARPFYAEGAQIKDVLPEEDTSAADIPQYKALRLNIDSIILFNNAMYNESGVRLNTDIRFVGFGETDSTTGEKKVYGNFKYQKQVDGVAKAVDADTPTNLAASYAPGEYDTYYEKYIPVTIICHAEDDNTPSMIIAHNSDSILAPDPENLNSMHLIFEYTPPDTETLPTFPLDMGRKNMLFIHQFDTRETDLIAKEMALAAMHSAYYYFMYEASPEIIIRAISTTFGSTYRSVLNTSDDHLKLMITQIMYDTIVEYMDAKQPISEQTINRWGQYTSSAGAAIGRNQDSEASAFKENYIRSKNKFLDSFVDGVKLKSYLDAKDNWASYIQGYTTNEAPPPIKRSALIQKALDEQQPAPKTLAATGKGIATIFIVEALPQQLFHDVFDMKARYRNCIFTAGGSGDLFDPFNEKYFDIKIRHTAKTRGHGRSALYFRTSEQLKNTVTELSEYEVEQDYLLMSVRNILGNKDQYLGYKFNMVLMVKNTSDITSIQDGEENVAVVKERLETMLDELYTRFTTKLIKNDKVTDRTEIGLPGDEEGSPTKFIAGSFEGNELWLRIIINKQ